jgi:endoglucanase
MGIQFTGIDKQQARTNRQRRSVLWRKPQLAQQEVWGTSLSGALHWQSACFHGFFSHSAGSKNPFEGLSCAESPDYAGAVRGSCPRKTGDTAMKNLTRAIALALACASIPLAQAAQPSTDSKGAPLIHLNVAAAGWGGSVLPGVENKHYVFPDANYLDKWQQGGIRVIRFSILWERLQPQLLGDFDRTYAQRIDTFLDQAAERDMGVIIDIHNYGRYYGKIIGTPDVPTSSYQDLMTRVAERWGTHPGTHGYDLMNEPYGEADAHWGTNAQAGIDGVRAYDKAHPIYVEGRAFSSAAQYAKLNNDLLDLKDPADNLIYSAHLYLDKGSSGRYDQPIDERTYDPMYGVKRVQPFVEWLVQHNKRGQLGEFGVPDNDPRWLTSMDNLLAYLHEHCMPVAYWAAGPWWNKDPVAIEPIDGVARPQWPVLAKWIEKTNQCP